MKEKDLESAASYIYRDSPVYAASFVDRVLEAGRSLDAFAERGKNNLESTAETLSLVMVRKPPLLYALGQYFCQANGPSKKKTQFRDVVDYVE
jgi:plasmid stabilization system protein ParE